MSLLVTIAARGGSKGVPQKNIRPLCGKPLIAHTIAQAQRWGRADRLIVSTDAEDIAVVARAAGAEVPFLRPAALATDAMGKVPVLVHALAQAEAIYQTRFDAVMDLDATAPLRTVDDLEQCYRLFLQRRPKTLFSVVPSHKNPYFNMVEQDTRGFAVLCKRPAQPVLRRQDVPEVYSLNASIYVYRRDFLASEPQGSVVTDESLLYVMDERSAYDVDREIDFQFIEYLVQAGQATL